MGAVKTFLNLQMSILTSLPPLQASAPTPNNKWLLLTVLLVMTPENKQKSINNNLPRKNEPLNKTDTKLGSGKWHLRGLERKGSSCCLNRSKKKEEGLIQSLIQGLNIWLLSCARCFPWSGVMLFADYSLLHSQKKKKKNPPPNTLSWVSLNNKAAPAQVVYPDTKAIPHIN